MRKKLEKVLRIADKYLLLQQKRNKNIETMQVLKVIRQHGKTLEEVASALGVTKGTFSVTINNKPKLQRLFDIANYLNCSPAEFFADWDTAPENIHRIAEQQQPEDAESEMLQQDEDADERASEQSEVDEKLADDVQKEQKNDELPFKDEEPKQESMPGVVICPHCKGRFVAEISFRAIE